MQSTKQHKTLGKEKLERIIEMCIAIENHTADPFTLNIDEIIKIVREYFPHWEHPGELKLDAETLHHLASVIKLHRVNGSSNGQLRFTLTRFCWKKKSYKLASKRWLTFFLKVCI